MPLRRCRATPVFIAATPDDAASRAFRHIAAAADAIYFIFTPLRRHYASRQMLAATISYDDVYCRRSRLAASAATPRRFAIAAALLR